MRHVSNKVQLCVADRGCDGDEEMVRKRRTREEGGIGISRNIYVCGLLIHANRQANMRKGKLISLGSAKACLGEMRQKL